MPFPSSVNSSATTPRHMPSPSPPSPKSVPSCSLSVSTTSALHVFTISLQPGSPPHPFSARPPKSTTTPHATPSPFPPHCSPITAWSRAAVGRSRIYQAWAHTHWIAGASFVEMSFGGRRAREWRLGRKSGGVWFQWIRS